MTTILPGDLVRLRVIGGADDAILVSRELAQDTDVTEQFTPIPAVEKEVDGSFGVIDIVQDFIVGAGVELTGAAVVATVQGVVARIRKRRKETEQATDDEVTVSVQGEGVAEVVVRLRSNS